MEKIIVTAEGNQRLPGARRLARYGILLAATMLTVAPGVAWATRSTMLDSLSPGMWTVRDRHTGAQDRICVRTGREFIQLGHRQARCSRFLIRNLPNEVVVQYTCEGEDYGRTTIRQESSALVQIASQGIRNGRPFTFNGEARRSGRC